MKETTHILAVDDVEAKRYSWERILKRAGFRVSTASTGREALERTKENPDLIILDIRLPDMNGMEVCRRIKEDPSSSSIPVLHISASLVTAEDRTLALESGADAYLTEPVDPEELVASVRALLRMRRAEDEARRSASEWQATFDAIQDGIVVLDAAGSIIRCNGAFLSLVGLRAPEAQRSGLRGLLAGRLPPDSEFFEHLVDCRTRRTTESRWGDRWFRITLDPVLPQGSPAGCICIFSDVTERKRALHEIQAGKDELRRLNSNLEGRVVERTQRLQTAVQELEAFTYTIAHDLRAPLRAMHRFSEILDVEYADRFDAEGRDYLGRIVAGAEKMDSLIDDLLAYSRLAQSEIHCQPLQPAELADEVAHAVTWDAPAPVPEIRVDEPLPLVYGDRILLRQVFQNLLSNALKFVAPGTAPKVRISGERQGGQVLLRVSDNGIGIAPESQSRLFRVFERLGNSREYPGTGIGLAIVRRAMERMNGACGVDSEPGKGSRFWIRLPAVDATSSGGDS